MPLIPIGRPIDDGVLDELDVQVSGRIHVRGWSVADDPARELRVSLNGALAAPHESFHVFRADVVKALKLDSPFVGFSSVYTFTGLLEEISVGWRKKEIFRTRLGVRAQQPDYAHLFDETRVLGREAIYGAGPPTPSASPEVLALARRLAEPILDFGCGSGALVRALRQAGLSASGIEISRAEIAQSLQEDVRPHIKLYDGRFPLPFRDGQFASVVCSEVLEHIPDFAAAVREMARLAPSLLLTVPDISSIPTLFPHRVVPWHLLEATHVNFFTERSLRSTLADLFPDMTFFRLGAFEINRTRAYTSLGVLCHSAH
jgi:SAM-dependent methyltransferase